MYFKCHMRLDEARADVIVRVRGSVVQVEIEYTTFRAIVPVTRPFSNVPTAESCPRIIKL